MLKPKKHFAGNKKRYTFATVNKRQQVYKRFLIRLHYIRCEITIEVHSQYAMFIPFGVTVHLAPFSGRGESVLMSVSECAIL